MKSSLFIGIDVSAGSLDCAVEGQSGVLQVANEKSAIRQWLKQLPEFAVIGVEATGSYHQLLVRLAITAGHTVYVLNARDVSHYARALGRRAKTDRLDAQLLARYLAREHEQLHPFQLPTELQTQLESLVQRRHVMITTRASLRQSFAAMKNLPRHFARMLRDMDTVVDELDQHLQDLVLQDPALTSAARNLDTMVGFGSLLAGTMANAITRRPYKNSDAFIASLGLDLRVYDSGQSKGRRHLSKRGPSELRRLLYVGAMSASKTKLWRPFYQRYRDRGFSSTAALIILARKLARIAFSIVKHGTTFQPELVKIACAKP